MAPLRSTMGRLLLPNSVPLVPREMTSWPSLRSAKYVIHPFIRDPDSSAPSTKLQPVHAEAHMTTYWQRVNTASEPNQTISTQINELRSYHSAFTTHSTTPAPSALHALSPLPGDTTTCGLRPSASAASWVRVPTCVNTIPIV